MTDVDVAFEWILPESQAAEQLAELESAGGSVSNSGGRYEPRPDEVPDYPGAGFEPLTLIAAVAKVTYIVSTVLKMWRDGRTKGPKGGVVLDLRGSRVRLRPVPMMRAGQLVVIQDSATQVFKESEENEAGRLMSSVIEAVATKRP